MANRTDDASEPVSPETAPGSSREGLGYVIFAVVAPLAAIALAFIRG